VRRPVADWLALCLCLDRPTSIRYVNPSDLATWGVTEDEAFGIGLAGLERQSGTEGGFEHEQGGVYRSVYQDTYDAARAALPWLVRKVPAPGGRALSVPNRNTLLVASLDDERAVLELAQLTEREADDPRRVSYRVFSLVDETLTPLRVNEQHPAGVALRRLAALDVADQSAIQRDRLHETDLLAFIQKQTRRPPRYFRSRAPTTSYPH